jgi:hypothetical protein
MRGILILSCRSAITGSLGCVVRTDQRPSGNLAFGLSLSARRHTLFHLLEAVEDDDHPGRRRILIANVVPRGSVDALENVDEAPWSGHAGAEPKIKASDAMLLLELYIEGLKCPALPFPPRAHRCGVARSSTPTG